MSLAASSSMHTKEFWRQKLFISSQQPWKKDHEIFLTELVIYIPAFIHYFMECNNYIFDEYVSKQLCKKEMENIPGNILNAEDILGEQFESFIHSVSCSGSHL